ncbi:MAG TPA: glycoside hydrolase family 16 protein, partial [Chryseosolibacter sp.]|nr:glycoside hydrolase family 16 protein [Chryseosolibacter sp.]
MKYGLLLIAVVSFAACETNRERKLVWSDEFEVNGSPDSTKWGYDLGDGCPDNCGWGNNELQYYTRDAKNVRVEDGYLIVEAHKDSL